MNKIFQLLSISICVALLMVGCAKKPKINLANLRDNTTNATQVPDNGPAFVSNDFSAGQPAIPGLDNGKANGDWSDMSKPVNVGDGANAYINNPQPWEGKVYFDYNRYEIKESERPVLDKLADFLTKNGEKALVIEGHCDERGSDEYNRSLSEKRALAIRDYLNAMGIENTRMFTISYGVDRPEIPNATTEAEHRLNRRGQFLFGDKK